MFWIDHIFHRFDNNWKNQGQPRRVSAIVPVHAAKVAALSGILHHLDQLPESELEIIVVNNGVPAESFPLDAAAFKHQLIIHSTGANRGAAFARNAGAQVATGEYLWFIDCDALSIQPGALEFMRHTLQTRPDIGALGGQLLQSETGVILSLGRFQDPDFAHHPNKYAFFPDEYVNTTCMMVRRETFYEIQGFCDVMEYMHEDADFGFRIRRLGLYCMVDHRALALHPPSQSPLESSVASHKIMVYKNIFLFYLFNYTLRDFLRFIKLKRHYSSLKPIHTRPSSPAGGGGRPLVGLLRESGLMAFALLALFCRLHKLAPVLRYRRQLSTAIDALRIQSGRANLSRQLVFSRDCTCPL